LVPDGKSRFSAAYVASRAGRHQGSGSAAMPDELTQRDAKLIQYLNEAFGKEKELEAALRAHIKMADSRVTYKRRLQAHLKETEAQARALERRIKQLAGASQAASVLAPRLASDVAATATAAATKAMATAKGAVHAMRGLGEAEKLLKNAKSELSNEYEEIGNYVAIEALAQAVGDRDTEKLAREHRRQEERMASFLIRLLPQLTKAVAAEEIPAAQRRAGTGRGTTRSRRPSRSTARAGSRRSPARGSS
jgi:ferritin-like metal-binding protein YciE